MIHKLKKSQYEKALPVVEGVEHALIAKAVLEGTSPGSVYVDKGRTPRTAFLSTPEGHYLVGYEQDDAFNTSLKELIAGTILPEGKDAGWWYFLLHYYPDTWEETLDAMFEGWPLVKDYQTFYKLKGLNVDWKGRIPSGFRMARVDEALLRRTDLKNIERLSRWAKGNFGSIEGFVNTGFGFCLLHDNEMVSWCMADCVSGNKCEIGIHTDKRYRRRGFAKLTAAAAVEYCLSHGLTHIGWHCWSYNLPSAATAEKVGFEKVLDHHAFKVWFNDVDPLLMNGNIRLMREQFKEAGEYYETAFQIAEAAGTDALDSHLFSDKRDAVRYYYQAACAWALAGERESALRNLNKAIDRSCRQGGF